MPLGRRPEVLRELVRFALVGGVGLVIDVAVFNALRTTVFSPGSMQSGPVIAKTISTSLAILANWIGNRLWTFRTHRRQDVAREGIEFAVVSVAGMFIAVACLWVSHYMLGFTSLLADNVSSNVVGLLLGAAFRFLLYRWWVFAPARVLSRHRHPDIGASASARNRMSRPVRYWLGAAVRISSSDQSAPAVDADDLASDVRRPR